MEIKGDLKDRVHVMVDIETLGTRPGSVITSIAAVAFNIETGNTLGSFYRKLNLTQSQSMGFEINAATLEWWLTQDAEVLKESLSNATDVRIVLSEFADFLNGYGDPFVWGNSNRFDMGLLQAYYDRTVHVLPWNFRLEMDVRTISNLLPDVKNSTENVGDAHNPIDDCLFQIKYLVETLKQI